MNRRQLLAAVMALGFMALGFAAQVAGQARAADLPELRIGFQKSGLTAIAQRQKLIESALPGTKVTWVEFSSGPPLVEALNAGAIDLGSTGDLPPIFAQAAGADFVYVAALPGNDQNEAIIAKKSTGIATLADLKGKRLAFGKGTSAHNLVVAALETAGISLDAVKPVYLSPPDAAAAFQSDQIDAWAIWDPQLAIAEGRYDLNVLVRTGAVLHGNTFYLANRNFAVQHPQVILATLKALGQATDWAASHRDEVAAALHDITGVPLEVQTVAAARAKFDIFPITPEIVANQQATADRFTALGLIPKTIKVSDAVWTPPQI